MIKYKHINKIQFAQKKYNFIEIVFWEDFIAKLYDLELHKLGLIYSDSISYFEKILNITGNKYEFSKEEIVMINSIKDLKNANSIFRKLDTICNYVIEELKEKYSDISFKSVFIEEDYGVGCWINFGDHDGEVFLGYSFNISNNEYEYAFSLAISDSLWRSNNSKAYSVFKQDNWSYFKIDRYWCSDDDGIRKLSEYCISILDKCLK